MEVEVQRYHADLVTGRKTYYRADGDFEDVEVHKAGGAPGEFSAEGVEKAVNAIQRQEIGYREFCRLNRRRGVRRLFCQPHRAPRRSIMAAPGTSTSNGFPAQSPESLTALYSPPLAKGPIPCSITSCFRTQQLDVMTAFYELALAPLGIKKLMAFERRGGIWSRCARSMDQQIERTAVQRAPGVVLQPDESAVRAFHNAALRAGEKDNGAPGPRDFAPNYYAAFVIDPDGNNIEAACRGA